MPDPWGRRPAPRPARPERSGSAALGACRLRLSLGSASSGNGTGRGQADVFIPGETHAEKEGTVTHPDGRLQRLRPNIPHPGHPPGTCGKWLADLAARLGDETGYRRRPGRAAGQSPPKSPSTPGLTPDARSAALGAAGKTREAASSFAGTSDEVAVPAPEPAGSGLAPSPAGNVGEAEASGGGISHDAAADGLKVGHLSRFVGQRGHRAFPRPPVPDAGPAGSSFFAGGRRPSRYRSRRGGGGPLQRPQPARPRHHPRAHPPGRRLPDRGRRSSRIRMCSPEPGSKKKSSNEGRSLSRPGHPRTRSKVAGQ